MSKRSRRVKRKHSPEIPETSTFNVQTLAAFIDEVKKELNSSQERMRNEILNEINVRFQSIQENDMNRRLNTTVAAEQSNGERDQIPLHSPIMPLTSRSDDANERLLRFTRGALIDHGSESKIDAESWIKLFDHVAQDLGDDIKTRALTSYLSNDTLMWFSDEIAGRKMNWTDTRAQFLSRYCTATIPPSFAVD